jgi:plasmid stability protein
MTVITIDLPDDVRDELAARAARRGRSLEQYLRETLTEDASFPDPEDWIAQVRAHAEAGGAALRIEDVLADKDADRK